MARTALIENFIRIQNGSQDLLIAVFISHFCNHPVSYELLFGQCGDNVFWTAESREGPLIITGTGPMYDFNEGFWHRLNNELTFVDIQEGVTTIGNNAFNGCTNVNSLTFNKVQTSLTLYSLIKKFRLCPA